MDKKLENRIQRGWCEVCGSKDTDITSTADKSEWRVQCKKEGCLEERNYMS